MGCARAIHKRYRHLVANGAVRTDLIVVSTPMLPSSGGSSSVRPASLRRDVPRGRSERRRHNNALASLQDGNDNVIAAGQMRDWNQSAVSQTGNSNTAQLSQNGSYNNVAIVH